MRLKGPKSEKHVANQQLVKETNLTLIFNLIYKYGPVSRAELANKTKLSPTTVSSLAEELLRSGMIMETGAGTTTTSGRKPIMLETNPNGGYVISVEMLENGFNCYLYDLKCSEICGGKFDISEYGLIGAEIAKVSEQILKKMNVREDKLLGICIGAPGLIDTENNRVISSTVIPIDEHNEFYNTLKARFANIPILLENESCLCAYAEKEFGTDGEIRNLVFIDVINAGIGAGIIINGSMFRGSFGLAGEVGHISIDLNGPKCKCGNRGCLEVVAGIPAMIQKVIFAIMSGRETVVRDIINNDFNRIDIDIIKIAVEKGDQLIMEVLDEISYKLAAGINNVINLFNPQVIVIGGEILKIGNIFLEKLKNTLYSIELKPNVNRVVIKYSNLKGNTVTLGGSRFLLDNIFKTTGLLSKSLWNGIY